MLRISIIEAPEERKLELEGKLIPPWTTELGRVCQKAREGLAGRTLLVNLNNLTAIGQQGEDLIAALMSEGVKFRCRGVFARQVLRQVARRPEAQLVRGEVGPDRGKR